MLSYLTSFSFSSLLWIIPLLLLSYITTNRTIRIWNNYSQVKHLAKDVPIIIALWTWQGESALLCTARWDFVGKVPGYVARNTHFG